jgi:hypothetical protein
VFSFQCSGKRREEVLFPSTFDVGRSMFDVPPGSGRGVEREELKPWSAVANAERHRFQMRRRRPSFDKQSVRPKPPTSLIPPAHDELPLPSPRSPVLHAKAAWRFASRRTPRQAPLGLRWQTQSDTAFRCENDAHHSIDPPSVSSHRSPSFRQRTAAFPPSAC